MIVLFLPAKLRGIVKRHRPLRWLMDITILLFIVCILMVVSYQIFEHSASKGPIEAGWQGWQTITTIGYGNLPPATLLGRLSFMIFGSAGLAIFGTFISAVFMAVEYQKDRARLGMTKNPFKDGYVILNFPGEEKFNTFFNEITFIEEGIGICVVDNELPELPETIALLPNVHFMQGSILDKKTFEKANIRQNKAVVIFTPQKISDSLIDGLTKTVVESIEQFSQTRTIYEIVDANRHEYLFQNVRGSAVRADLAILATVQECHDAGSASLLTELLKNTSGPNPNTVRPELTVGWNWGELVTYGVQASTNLETPANFLGLFHEGRPFPCPISGTIIHTGDTLSVAAFPDFDWQKFEEEMARCKSLASSS